MTAKHSQSSLHPSHLLSATSSTPVPPSPPIAATTTTVLSPPRSAPLVTPVQASTRNAVSSAETTACALIRVTRVLVKKRLFAPSTSLCCMSSRTGVICRCPDGKCVEHFALCSIRKNICTEGRKNDLLSEVEKPIRCWNNECVANLKDCTNSDGCPYSRPFRCITDECVAVRKKGGCEE